MKRRRHAVRGENDRRLLDGIDFFDRAHTELLHLFNHTLIVHDLAEDRAAAACGGETLHLEVGDAHPGAEAVFGCALDLHPFGLNVIRIANILSRYNPMMSERRPVEPLFTPAFAGLWVYAFVTFFSAFQLLPAIPFRILNLGGSKAEAGWFLSVYTYASAFAAPLMGSIADHIGRRRLLITASILFIAFSIAYGVITNLPLLLIVGAIHGSIWSAILSSASAIMSEYIPVSRRSQGIAYWGLASTGAIAVAPAVGLWVFHFGWITLCLELAALSVLMAVGAL